MEEGTSIVKDRRRFMMGIVRRGKKRWRIVGVYGRREEMEKTLDELGKWAEEGEEKVMTLVGGDFNARTE